MRYIKTKLKFVGTKDSIATQNIESLFDRFEMMQEERLQSPIRLPEVFRQESLHSVHRVFVRVYCVSSERDQQAH